MAKTAPDSVLPKIYAVRRQKVVLDADRATLDGMPTKRLNEAVRRNAARFPKYFSFSTTRDELMNLMSQFSTSSSGHGGGRVMPRVFTGHGALMAANVLRSERAVQMSLYLIRAFVALREQLVSNLSTLRRFTVVGTALRAVRQFDEMAWNAGWMPRRGVPAYDFPDPLDFSDRRFWVFLER